MLKDLVKNEWWTDASVKTDENGCIMVDAFKGAYRISVGKSASEVELTDDTEMTVTIN
ncbi:hypothetical protein SAMN02910371_01249 [Butyrivibrio sp. INlla14]|nr:hypothetical protein SAMN02910371_01249 [Butyrivibrio sp. INlla14]